VALRAAILFRWIWRNLNGSEKLAPVSVNVELDNSQILKQCHCMSLEYCSNSGGLYCVARYKKISSSLVRLTASLDIFIKLIFVYYHVLICFPA